MTADDVETAHAKLNLALHIRRRRSDGYHELETLFAFCEHGDILTVTPDDGLTMAICGEFADGLCVDEANLVIRAANLLQRKASISSGAAFTLDKRLPVASGIGGGSADAAAALRLLNRMWSLGWPLERLAKVGRELGADVPACVLSQSARGEGVGERLTPSGDDGLKGTPVLLVNPRVPVSTADIFRAWDGQDGGALATGDMLVAARAGRNDLTAPALSLAPEIAAVLNVLSGLAGTTLVRMSGSGATCFALFGTDSDRDAAHAQLIRDHRGWWALATRLLR